MQTVEKKHRPVLTMDALQRVCPPAFADQPHSAVSKKYNYISTTNVMSVLQDYGWEPVAASVSKTRDKSRNGFQRHLIRLVNQREDYSLDGAQIETILINSHDRSSPYKIMVGAYRFACANGLVVGSTMCSFSIRHIGHDDYNVEQVAKQLIERIPTTIETCARWQNIAMTAGEQQTFANSAIQFRWDEKTMTKIKFDSSKLLKARRVEDNGYDLWRTYNRVQENLIRGGITYHVYGEDNDYKQCRKMRAVKSITQDLQINRNLWNLAETYAEAVCV